MEAARVYDSDEIFLFIPHQNSDMRISHTLNILSQSINLDSKEYKL